MCIASGLLEIGVFLNAFILFLNVLLGPQIRVSRAIICLMAILMAHQAFGHQIQMCAFILLVIVILPMFLEFTASRILSRFATTPPHGATPLGCVRDAGPVVIFFLVVHLVACLTNFLVWVPIASFS